MPYGLPMDSRKESSCADNLATRRLLSKIDPSFRWAPTATLELSFPRDRKLCDNGFSLARLVQAADPQLGMKATAMNLLRRSVGQLDIHLWRCLSSAVLQDYTSSTELAVQQFVAQMMGIPALDAQQTLVMHLPMEHGGLDLPPRSEACAKHYLNANLALRARAMHKHVAPSAGQSFFIELVDAFQSRS